MANLNLPTSPSDGQVVTHENTKFIYNQAKNVWYRESLVGRFENVIPATDTSISSTSITGSNLVFTAADGTTSNVSLNAIEGGAVTVYANESNLPASAQDGSHGFVTGTDNLYIRSSGAWRVIDAVNLAPTVTASISSHTFADSAESIDITYTVTEPEGTPVTVTTSNTGIANTSQVNITHHSGNNTITVVSGTSELFGGTLLIRATDGTNIQSDSVTLDFSLQVANSKAAVLNLSVNPNYDNTHNNSEFVNNNRFATFKDETGLTNPQPKHNADATERNVFHSNVSPYHPAGYSAQFNGSYSVINNDGYANMPGTGACTWEMNIFVTSKEAPRNQNNGSRRSVALTGRDTNQSAGAEQNGSWAMGLHGGTSVTATGVYLFYRQNNQRYKKIWHQVGEDSTTPIPRGQWHHLAIVRASSTDSVGNYKCYLNGVELDQNDHDIFPDDMNYTGSGAKYAWFGGYQGENGLKSYGAPFKGMINDYRLTHRAVYTSNNFTPPQAPFFYDFSIGTSNPTSTMDSDIQSQWPSGPMNIISTGQPTSYIGTGDFSNSTKVEYNGNIQNNMAGASKFEIVRRSPYDYNVEAVKNLGSVSMHPFVTAGRGGITTGPVDTNNNGSESGIALGTGPWTIEFWFKARHHTGGTSNQARMTLVDFRNNGSNNGNYAGPYFYIDKPLDGNQLKGDNPNFSTYNHKIAAGVWYHMAITRDGDNSQVYLNGRRASGTTYMGSATRNYNASNGRPFWGTFAKDFQGGSGTRETFNGHMTDMRIVVGTCVYTGDFTPPTGPLTLTGGEYPVATNINTAIPSGHVKQLLNFKNHVLMDTAGVETPYSPDYAKDTSFGPVDIIKSDSDNIANWPSNEPSELGGGSTTGKSYLYFNPGSSNANFGSKLIYPYSFDTYGENPKESAVLDAFGNGASASRNDGYGFCVEGWIYPMQLTNGHTNSYVWSYGLVNENNGAISLKLEQQHSSAPGTADSNGDRFQWIVDRKSQQSKTMATGNQFNQWYHYALVFLAPGLNTSNGRAGEYRLFINGQRDLTRSIYIPDNEYVVLRSSGNFVLGGPWTRSGSAPWDSPTNNGATRHNFHGIMRNLRVEHGNKYWDNNFTPIDFTTK